MAGKTIVGMAGKTIVGMAGKDCPQRCEGTP